MEFLEPSLVHRRLAADLGRERRMIVGLGLDVVEVERIRKLYERHGARFLNRVFTAQEQAYALEYAQPAERLAGRWAAKEAAVKALGGVEGVGWRELEIIRGPRGEPGLRLHGKALEQAKALGADVFHLTITHAGGLAAAQVILERKSG